MTIDELPKEFDPDLYSQAYPDVALSGLDPRTHYLKYGKLFGRAPNPDANARRAACAKTDPALLDLRYAQGILPRSEPVRHAELVSILMPSHNNEQWLTRAIHAALSQQGVEVEVILIDDGSTDGSVRLARQIANRAPNLKVISLLRNFGCYYARNIGVMNAKGAFVTILDTDDIMAPDRIARQLDALKAVPEAVACHCQQRRWTPDYTAPVSQKKYGENSLIWRREVIGRIGFYDTVRYSGDGEFRMRLEAIYGSNAILQMPDELYFTRTLEGSLTTSVTSRVFTLQEGQLAVTMSPSRKAYRDQFRSWHKTRANLTAPFPLVSRQFELGADEQNASPSLGQRRIGTMASFAARRESLKAVLARILPQLDELRLYLNDYDEIPDFALNPAIRVVLGKDAAGDLRDNGKFHDLPIEGDCYVFTLDDDLHYPHDYVARMIHNIEMLGRTCVVGAHGVIFPRGEFSNLDQREVDTFSEPSPGHFVDLLGTGTTAWHSSILHPCLNEFASKGQCDLWFAAAASRRGVALFSVQREQDWLTEHIRHDDSLYREAVDRPDGYFQTYHSAIAPVLQKGRVRREMTAHLGRCYDSDTLAAAGIAIPDNDAFMAGDLVSARRPTTHFAPLPTSGQRPAQTPSRDRLHFHIVVNGWNCREYLTPCLRSIAQQMRANYSFDVTLIDDHSTDGTYEDLTRTAILPRAELIRIAGNTGPAHARHVGIQTIKDPDTIVVLLDMDDALEPHALRTVAECYRANPDCLLTIGNWHDQDGKKNPQDFYTADEIDNQRIREIELFNATHLRTFRRRLYDAVEASDLLDHEGNWLETCTDVALMYPLVDQCRSHEVVFIDDPIYRYTRKHGSGTLARFGKPHKVERLNWLKGKVPKARLAANRKAG